MAKKTKICCLNLDSEIVSNLSISHDVYEGCLGIRSKTSTDKSLVSYFLPNVDFPANIQEYGVFVVDMQKPNVQEYDACQHNCENITSSENRFYLCQQPQNIFDSTPLGSYWLGEELKKQSKSPILIIFQESKYTQTYISVNKLDSYGHISDREDFSFSNYNFLACKPLLSVVGQEISMSSQPISRELFEGLLEKIEYRQTFYMPKRFDECSRSHVDDSSYVPLLYNLSNDVVSYIHLGDAERNEPILFVLPQADVKTKQEMLKRLFERVLYVYFSDYFPWIEEKNWINKADYQLPEVILIQKQKEDAKKQFEKQQQAFDESINKIKEEKGFLPKLLTATGDELVNAVIQYLHWLGFSSAISQDERETGDPQEDIQVDLGKEGLLIIEVKGIQHTSQDKECGQIGKIKHRREYERKAFDVKALYVVNHQRSVEPLKRINPPFTEQQIKDAQYDKRGLVSTWQLYFLYNDVENGVISKEEAREQLLNYGLVKFSPASLLQIGKPDKYWCNDKVIGVDSMVPMSIGDEVFVLNNGKWYKSTVLEVRQKDIPVEHSIVGRITIQLHDSIPRDVLYVRRQSD